MASSLKLGEVRDANMDYLLKRVFVPAASIVTGQVTGASTVIEMTMGSGTADLVELGTSGIGALKLAATTDEIDFLWVPSDFDNRQRLLIRHLWTSDYATANGTATFTNKYTAIAEGTALTIGATAFTKAGGAGTKVSATARTVYWSPYSYLAPIATGANAGQTFGMDTVAVAIDITCSAVTGITIASDFVYWLGAELVYTPRATFGDGSGREGRLLSLPLGRMEAGAAADV